MNFDERCNKTVGKLGCYLLTRNGPSRKEDGRFITLKVMDKVKHLTTVTPISFNVSPSGALDFYLLLKEIQRSINIEVIDPELYENCADLLEKLRYEFLRSYLMGLDSAIFAPGAMSGIHEMVSDRMRLSQIG